MTSNFIFFRPDEAISKRREANLVQRQILAMNAITISLVFLPILAPLPKWMSYTSNLLAIPSSFISIKISRDLRKIEKTLVPTEGMIDDILNLGIATEAGSSLQELRQKAEMLAAYHHTELMIARGEIGVYEEEPQQIESQVQQGLPASESTVDSRVLSSGPSFEIASSVDPVRVIVETGKTFKIPLTHVNMIKGLSFDRYMFDKPANVKVTSVLSSVFLKDLEYNLKLSQETPVTAFTDSGLVIYDVPKKDRIFPKFSDYIRFEGNRNTSNELIVTPGLDMRGELVNVNFADSDSCQMLNGGNTGSGKSEALYGMILSAIYRYDPSELQVYLADGKRDTYAELEDLPHLPMQIAKSPDDLLIMTEILERELNDRNEQFIDIERYRRESGEVIPRILYMIDEFGDFRNNFISQGREKDFTLIEAKLTRIAQKGRSLGMHICLGTQKPTEKVVDSELRGQLKALLGFTMGRPEESKVILGESVLKANKLLGKGDGILRINNSEVRLQGFHTGIKEGWVKQHVQIALQRYSDYANVLNPIPEPALTEPEEGKEYAYRYPSNWDDISQLSKRLTKGYCSYPGCWNQAIHTHHAFYMVGDELRCNNPDKIYQLFPLCNEHHLERTNPDSAHHPNNWIHGTLENPRQADSRNTDEYLRRLLLGKSEKMSLKLDT